MLLQRISTVGSVTVCRIALCAVATQAGAEGFECHGPEYPVDGYPGPLSLRALGIRDEAGGGGDQVRRVAVGALDAPGKVLQRDARDHLVPLENGSRGNPGCTLVAEADVLHENRGDDGEGDGDEGEDEAVVKRIRKAISGDLQDLAYELLPAGES